MMMAYIGIHPDEYSMDILAENSFDCQPQDMIMWGGEWRDPSLLWESLIVSTLQATAARAIPLEMRSQLPETALRELHGEFDLFRSLIPVKFKLKTECDKTNIVAYDILDSLYTFEDGPYASLSRAEKLTVDMTYLRHKHALECFDESESDSEDDSPIWLASFP